MYTDCTVFITSLQGVLVFDKTSGIITAINVVVNTPGFFLIHKENLNCIKFCDIYVYKLVATKVLYGSKFKVQTRGFVMLLNVYAREQEYSFNLCT